MREGTLKNAALRPWEMQSAQGENQIIGCGRAVERGHWVEGRPVMDVSAWMAFPTEADIDLILFAVNNVERLLEIERAARELQTVLHAEEPRHWPEVSARLALRTALEQR